VRAVLVNIFGGGFVSLRSYRDGVINAVKNVGVKVPVVVRLEGHERRQGTRDVGPSGLTITAATDLTDAARQDCRAG